MGYGDIGYQSSDLREVTPNLDRLASEGVKKQRKSSWQATAVHPIVPLSRVPSACCIIFCAGKLTISL
ncbi:unnamed protein product [Choristocarpus tenellus]